MTSGDNDTNPSPEEETMKRPLLAALAAGAMTLAVGEAIARDDLVLMRNAAQQFAVLPDGVRYPEGITANPATGAPTRSSRGRRLSSRRACCERTRRVAQQPLRAS